MLPTSHCVLCDSNASYSRFHYYNTRRKIASRSPPLIMCLRISLCYRSSIPNPANVHRPVLLTLENLYLVRSYYCKFYFYFYLFICRLVVEYSRPCGAAVPLIWAHLPQLQNSLKFCIHEFSLYKFFFACSEIQVSFSH
jgi:hypothetical protein